MILFWFGVMTEFFILLGAYIEYKNYGYSEMLTPLPSNESVLNALIFVSSGFIHVIHIVSGYWLSKGTKKSAIMGVSLSLFEIVYYFVPDINPVLYTSHGIAIRVLFAFVLFLIIAGRKELDSLKSENWRPWKNPLKMISKE